RPHPLLGRRPLAQPGADAAGHAECGLQQPVVAQLPQPPVRVLQAVDLLDEQVQPNRDLTVACPEAVVPVAREGCSHVPSGSARADQLNDPSSHKIGRIPAYPTPTSNTSNTITPE